MSMPKGFKSPNGYATVSSIEGGMGYREIAEEMVSSGQKMNHSTARNIFLSAMHKLAREACELYGIKPDKNNLDRIAKDPRFQSGIVDVLS